MMRTVLKTLMAAGFCFASAVVVCYAILLLLVGMPEIEAPVLETLWATDWGFRAILYSLGVAIVAGGIILVSEAGTKFLQLCLREKS